MKVIGSCDTGLCPLLLCFQTQPVCENDVFYHLTKNALKMFRQCPYASTERKDLPHQLVRMAFELKVNFMSLQSDRIIYKSYKERPLKNRQTKMLMTN